MSSREYVIPHLNGFYVIPELTAKCVSIRDLKKKNEASTESINFSLDPASRLLTRRVRDDKEKSVCPE